MAEGFVFSCYHSSSKALEPSTSNTGCMLQEAPRECLAWLARCRGLCCLVRATHFCVKLKLSPHGQLVLSYGALQKLKPTHLFTPSISRYIIDVDPREFTLNHYQINLSLDHEADLRPTPGNKKTPSGVPQQCNRTLS